ncbi:hypothetical protein [Halobacterium salinarum]|uniref:hypothetical protein n=1 Tax=Halobacterium salinarum TaxID=2242 RepID=UPI0025565216|nr:hypothetical protein [Halobacterium salinarum]MDL0133736.1 hypothetical protein [Halobacterium salinarum]
MTDSDRDPTKEREQVGDEMSSRLASRFDDTDKEESSDSDEQPKSGSSSKNSKLSKTGQTDEREQKSVKDRPSVLMYLPEDLHSDLDIRFDELNAQYKREHGEALEKNRDYYPAVVKAGLEGKDIKDILDL